MMKTVTAVCHEVPARSAAASFHAGRLNLQLGNAASGRQAETLHGRRAEINTIKILSTTHTNAKLLLKESILTTINKLIHLPEEAALILHNHELSLVVNWQEMIENVAFGLEVVGLDANEVATTKTNLVHSAVKFNREVSATDCCCYFY